MTAIDKVHNTVIATVYSGIGLALAKGLALIDWHSIAEAGIKSAVWTFCGLAVTYCFNRVVEYLKNRK